MTKVILAIWRRSYKLSKVSIILTLKVIPITLELNTALISDRHESIKQWFHTIPQSISRGDAFLVTRGFILQFAAVFCR